MIRFIEPSVEHWPRCERGWISHLGRVAGVSRRAEKHDRETALRRLTQCYKQRHVGVFEHWPVVQSYAPPTDLYGEFRSAPWRRMAGRWYGTVRHCITTWDEADLPVAFIESVVHGGQRGSAIQDLRTFHFTCSRACADQLRTYRTYISYVMESQRYCNYSKLGFEFVCEENEATTARAQRVCQWYEADIDAGMPPEQARRWLPTTFATRMVVTAPVGKWNYIVQQRAHHSTGRAQDEIAGLIAQVEGML